MEKEPCLSNKGKLHHEGDFEEYKEYCFTQTDVKEFIKVFIEKCKCNNCRDLIRELAGDDLK